jgi:hypothetical protein
MASGSLVPRRDWVAQNPETGLLIILAIYLALGALYAVLTPPWQVIDEPAHLSYVRYVAEKQQLPILRSSDLPTPYLEDLKLWKFPPNMSIEELQYESYQPPLYYVLAAAAYRVMLPLGVPMPLGLRAFSLLLGLGAIYIGYKSVMAIFPNDPLPALGTAAFAATLPMHLALTAAVNNDVLARLVLNLAIWRLVTMSQGRWTVRRSFEVGALMGLGLLSGFSAYIIPGVAIVALVWDDLRTRREQKGLFLWRTLGYGGIMLGTALMIALPWLLRNVQVYGRGDLFGIGRHNQVTAALIAIDQRPDPQTWLTWLHDMVVVTFRSFWGEFGWMSVPLSPGLYGALALASSLVVIHLEFYMSDMVRGRVHLAPHAMRALALLVIWGMLTVASYFWLNTRVPQFQGRYLFPALVVWGLGWTLGLRKLFHSSPLPILALLAACIVSLFIFSIVTGSFRGFGITALALAMVIIGIGHWLFSRRPSSPLVMTYVGLAILAIASLFNYIIPGLS